MWPAFVQATQIVYRSSSPLFSSDPLERVAHRTQRGYSTLALQEGGRTNLNNTIDKMNTDNTSLEHIFKTEFWKSIKYNYIAGLMHHQQGYTHDGILIYDPWWVGFFKYLRMTERLLHKDNFKTLDLEKYYQSYPEHRHHSQKETYIQIAYLQHYTLRKIPSPAYEEYFLKILPIQLHGGTQRYGIEHARRRFQEMGDSFDDLPTTSIPMKNFVSDLLKQTLPDIEY